MAADRPILTREGRERLERELQQLRAKRPELLERLRETREASHGDSEELTDYNEVQWELARLDGQITELERLLVHAQVVEAPATHDVVAPGSTVVVRHEDGTERYTLVGAVEADSRQGRISVESPVGRALLGRRPGESVDVETPAGPRRLEVVAVE